MRKFLASLLLAAIMVFFCGCEAVTIEKANQNENPTSMFIEIERSGKWIIVYHRETMVMYAVGVSPYNTGSCNNGNFTLLVNADGSPMIYEEEKTE